MVQSKCFFLTPTRHLFAVKFVKWERYLVVLCLFGYIFFNVKRVEFLEIGEIFWAKRYCKIRYLFCQLFLALRISVKKSEIKKHSDDAHWNIWKNWHLSRFLKKSKFRFLGTALGRFSLFFFFVSQSWWLTFLLSPPPPTIIKILPTALT